MKKKLFIIIPAVVVFLILCFPMPYGIDDGGSVEYRAILYSVKKCHSMWTNSKEYDGYLPDVEEGADGYITGLEIRILGIEVYNNTKFEKRK